MSYYRKEAPGVKPSGSRDAASPARLIRLAAGFAAYFEAAPAAAPPPTSSSDFRSSSLKTELPAQEPVEAAARARLARGCS